MTKEFFYLKGKCFALRISKFILQKMWCHWRHCCTLEITLLTVFLESYVVSQWNLSDISAIHDRYFPLVVRHYKF